MGFSVSASAAIIFISFLIAASTLYTAWDNSYNNVQAAREDWYSLRESQLHLNVDNVDVSPSGTSDVGITFRYFGDTLTGNVVVLHNGTYKSTVNLGYLISGNEYTVVVAGGGDTSGATNYVTFGLDNGCTLLIVYHYDTDTSAYLVDGYSIQCPAEVS